MSRIISFPQNWRICRKVGPAATINSTTRLGVAHACDHVKDQYGRYADGEALDDPSAGINRFAHADTIVWGTIRKTVDLLGAAGVSTVRVLDAGCGPGAWIKRIASYANRVGLGIDAAGVDISSAQLEIARKHTKDVEARAPNLRRNIKFVTHDLANSLPSPDVHFHMVVCNYAVLNHLTRSAVPRAAGELCRVASHRVIATVRAVGSPPTGCIIGPEQVLDYHQSSGPMQSSSISVPSTSF